MVCRKLITALCRTYHKAGHNNEGFSKHGYISDNKKKLLQLYHNKEQQ